MRLSFLFTTLLSSIVLVEFRACTFQSGPRHNRPAYALCREETAKGASNRPEYDPNQFYEGRLPPLVSRTPCFNPRIYATLARILRDHVEPLQQGLDEITRLEQEGGSLWKDQGRRKGTKEISLIYTTVFLTSIIPPNNWDFGKSVLLSERRVAGWLGWFYSLLAEWWCFHEFYGLR